MIKISEVKVDKNFSKKDILLAISSFLNVEKSQILSYKILKKSLDARRKNDICYKCTFAVEIEGKLEKEYPEYVPFKRLEVDKIKKAKVLVVGSGPAGLFASYFLAKSGAEVTLVEKGEKMENRVKSVEAYLKEGKLSTLGNIQNGEGGAGTFSDGKLNTGINSPLAKEVLNIFYENGADENVLYDSRPHVGTDVIRKVVVNIRKKLEKMGVKIKFCTKFVDFEEQGDKILASLEGKGKEQILVDKLVLALGYSARDTHRMLFSKGIKYAQKPFSVGYRIEHLQSNINKAQYGTNDNALPPAEYKLFAHLNSGRTVYTFCMCPGGEVVPAVDDQNQIVTNGMSYHERKGKNANSAILVSVEPKDFGSSHPLAGIDFQEKLEKEAYQKGKGSFIVTRVGDFMQGKASFSLGEVKPTIRPKYMLGDVRMLLPKELNKDIKEGLIIFGKKIAGFDSPDALLTGIETRSSAPFMVERKENLQTSKNNIYMIGEGAGMAGGIVSSAVDGIKIALKIIEEGKDGNN